MNTFITKLRYLLITIALLLGSVSSDTIAAGYYNVGNWYQGLTVTYVGNGQTSGTAPEPTNYVSATTFTVSANSGNLTKTGYTFAGWNTQADGNGVNYTAGSGAMTLGSDNVTLYAKWSINSYTVTYDGNGSTGGAVPATASYNYNTTVTVSNNTGSLARSGYSFAGWNTAANGSGVSYAAGSGTFTITSNVMLYAQWTINSYTVTYNGNSNTGGSVPNSATYTYNTTVTVAANSGSLVRTGYTFAGWNTQTDGNGTNYAAGTGTFTLGAGNVTLYAKWTVNSYTVTYNNNGSTGGSVPAATSHNYNATVTVSANSGSLVRTGYSFAGWNTLSDGTGTNYAAGTGSFTMGAANVILYAKWTINSYTVTYNGNTNTTGSAPASANYNYNTTVTVAANSGSLARTGYTFSGWNTQADGNGTNYAAGTGSFTIGAGNVTLYAKWNINSYTVTYNGNSNTSGSAPASVNYNYNSTVTVAANTGSLTRTGYTFSGWNTQTDGNGTNYAAGTGSFTIGASNVTLYAKWTGNKRSCLEILQAGLSTGDGIYTITPQGLSAMSVYCDMTYNSGGWTLIASTDGATNSMPVVSTVTSTTAAGILNSSTVIALANLASAVRLTLGPVSGGNYRMSSASGTMTRLRSYLILNNPSMNGVNPNSDWTPTVASNNMYYFCAPDYNQALSVAVYHACGNGTNGMHWVPGWINSWDYKANNNLNIWVR